MRRGGDRMRGEDEEGRGQDEGRGHDKEMGMFWQLMHNSAHLDPPT